MDIAIKNEMGNIIISTEAISKIVGVVATECYGIVGMASQKQLKDGIAELLKRENLSKGIEVNVNEEGIHVNMYIIVLHGVKISEVAKNVQNDIKYALEEQIGINVATVNVFVQGVRLEKE